MRNHNQLLSSIFLATFFLTACGGKRGDDKKTTSSVNSPADGIYASSYCEDNGNGSYTGYPIVYQKGLMFDSNAFYSDSDCKPESLKFWVKNNKGVPFEKSLDEAKEEGLTINVTPTKISSLDRQGELNEHVLAKEASFPKDKLITAELLKFNIKSSGSKLRDVSGTIKILGYPAMEQSFILHLTCKGFDENMFEYQKTEAEMKDASTGLMNFVSQVNSPEYTQVPIPSSCFVGIFAKYKEETAQEMFIMSLDGIELK